MSKETLQHTMRSKVRVFEDGGIRLLRKGQKGLIHAIFSRFGLVLVLLVLQFGALFSLMRWFSNLLPHYLGGTLLVTAAMMVYLLNQDMNNSVRIPWLVVTALAPVLGVLLCLIAFVFMGFSLNYAITAAQPMMSESYPTEFRNSGVATIVALGKSAGILSPIILGGLKAAGWAFSPLIALLAVPMAFGFLAGFLLPKGAKGMNIDDIADEAADAKA